MKWHERGMEALVGGGAGLFVVASYIVLRSTFDGADAGDWLAFAGVIFGVALTTAGAALLVAIPGMLERRAQFALIRDALDHLIRSIDTLSRSKQDDALQIFEDTKEATRVVKQVLPYLKHRSVKVIAAINDFHDGTSKVERDLQYASKQFAGYGETHRVGLDNAVKQAKKWALGLNRAINGTLDKAESDLKAVGTS